MTNTTTAAPARATLWIAVPATVSADGWALEHKAAPLVLVQAAYHAAVRYGTPAQDLAIVASTTRPAPRAGCKGVGYRR
jgi:hypothetical protein